MTESELQAIVDQYSTMFGVVPMRAKISSRTLAGLPVVFRLPSVGETKSDSQLRQPPFRELQFRADTLADFTEGELRFATARSIASIFVNDGRNAKSQKWVYLAGFAIAIPLLWFQFDPNPWLIPLAIGLGCATLFGFFIVGVLSVRGLEERMAEATLRVTGDLESAKSFTRKEHYLVANTSVLTRTKKPVDDRLRRLDEADVRRRLIS